MLNRYILPITLLSNILWYIRSNRQKDFCKKDMCTGITNLKRKNDIHAERYSDKTT